MISDSDFLRQRTLRTTKPVKALPYWLVSLGIHLLLCVCLVFGFDRAGVPDGSSVNGDGKALQIIATFGETELPGNSQADFAVEISTEAQRKIAGNTDDQEAPPQQPLPAAAETEEVVAAEEPLPDSVVMRTEPTEEGPAVPLESAETENVAASPQRAAPRADSGSVRQASSSTNATADVDLDGGRPDGDVAGGGRGARFGDPDGTSFFQINAQGQHFCYVVDCSSSMDEDHTIDIARTELRASLLRLDKSRRFQILFYDAEIHLLMSGSESVFYATDVNRRLARQFMSSQQPTGRALHKTALLSALSSKPDVIFFLTDGEVPELSARDLFELKTSNRQKTQINVVEFGKGAKLEKNWLEQLARDHRGNYRYQDIDATADE